MSGMTEGDKFLIIPVGNDEEESPGCRKAYLFSTGNPFTIDLTLS